MYEDNLIYKVTWFYYADNMTQQEIAEHLGISRMRVVRLLNQAKSDGVIKFKINPDAKAILDLEHDLMKNFHLEDVFVVPSTPNHVNDNIAKGAAQYIEDKIEANAFINIGYGDTVSRTINHLIYSLEKPTSLVTLSGGVSYYTSAIVAGTANRSTTSITPNIHILPAPLLVSSEEVANILLQEKSVQDVMNMSELSHMSIVGIGSVSDTATIFKYGIASENDLTLLQMQGAVGDILSQFYDKNGNVVQANLHKKLISIKLDTLKTSHKTIGVAGGREKVQAIYSALIGGYIDVLITDEDTAKSLISFKNE
ncbi:DNA-binding transcriptional regulator LsrR, DeoR family [Anaerovirgula multivorans]|uniref:DNA-binding transcriptional regulator LsrR, DeoR family n=1 Tax=Anaerovirgula multivorans TaxID=312168 RepID=A0A239JY09_9FIRM|nr:sugar-binding transcriptional regulator [Anaerovirgula multivorans]SNT10368.1 DNA-binding transcriptional regulator LsrR, DeoR family [Anaerovirgula multivorans]